MKFEITHRHTGEVLYSAEINCKPNASQSWQLRLAALQALKANTSLKGANLHGADLRGAYLCGADLRGADLRGANLGGADLRGAELDGADLRGADLGGAYLRWADLRGANFNFPIATPEQAAPRIAEVAKAALEADALNMGVWHTCETTHCIAGWAVHLAGDEGKALEAEHGTHLAGLSLLGHEAAAHFFDNNEAATAWLRAKLDA
jgi:hypothetical protein